MEYYTKPFNYNNTLGLPCVTKEYFIKIGVRRVSVEWNNESAKNILSYFIRLEPYCPKTMIV